jgi:hypothetical protein
MPWPKGVKRGPRVRQTDVERTPIRKDQWKMKAGANWESVSDEAESEDKLHIPRADIPEGMDLRWVTSTVRGQPFARWRAAQEAKGWTPVHSEDFGGKFDGRFMAKGATGEITMDDAVLMARPLELSIKAKRRDKQRAVEQVRIKEAALKNGVDTLAMGANHPTAIASNKINRTYERLTIPQDE